MAETTAVTQLQFAREGTITPQMKRVAERDGIDPELVRSEVGAGRIRIQRHDFDPYIGFAVLD